MWPWGHAGIAYILFHVFNRQSSTDFLTPGAIIALLIGSQFPDLIDKPLAWYFAVLPTGRTLAHSLLFLVPICMVVLLIANRYDRIDVGIAFSLGAISHTLIDALPALWRSDASAEFLFWPILTVEAYNNGPPTLSALLADSMMDPYFLIEFPLVLLAGILWYRDGMPGLEWFMTRIHQLRSSIRIG